MYALMRWFVGVDRVGRVVCKGDKEVIIVKCLGLGLIVKI